MHAAQRNPVVTPIWIVIGTLVQLTLALFLFMIAVFVGGGLANTATLGRLPSHVLNASMYALPGSCVASAALVIILHWRGSSATAYLWYLLPLGVTACYLAYAVWLGRQG